VNHLAGLGAAGRAALHEAVAAGVCFRTACCVLHLAALRHRAAGTAGAVRGAAGVGLTAHVVVRAAVRHPEPKLPYGEGGGGEQEDHGGA